MTNKMFIKQRFLRICPSLRCAVVVVCLAVGVSARSGAQEQKDSLSLTPEQERVIYNLARAVQNEIKKERCSPSAYEILVTNFALPSGQTCSACILVSDALAKALGESSSGPEVISRASLGTFLDHERISSQFLRDRETMKWLGHQFHATQVVFGVVKLENDSVRLQAQVLEYEGNGDSTRTSKGISVKMPLGNLANGLSARESFQALAKRDLSLINAVPLDASLTAQKNTKLPGCFYMPNPQYTQAAREAKLSGSLIVEAIVTRQGTVIDPRIVRGLPFGLNENSIETLKTWRCKPAVQNGEPLAVVVPFEVTFRLY